MTGKAHRKRGTDCQKPFIRRVIFKREELKRRYCGQHITGKKPLYWKHLKEMKKINRRKEIPKRHAVRFPDVCLCRASDSTCSQPHLQANMLSNTELWPPYSRYIESQIYRGLWKISGLERQTQR